MTLTKEDVPEILRYSGFRKGMETGDVLDEKIDKAIETANLSAMPKTNWKLVDITENSDGIELTGTDTVFKGKNIRNHLKNCTQAVLMCATLGPKFDRKVKEIMLTDAAFGVLLNSAGVTLIEKVMDALQEEINEKLPEGHTGLRFSPGYGDFPLETQKDFMRLLNMERTVGIRLNEGLLMNPEKSVTAVSGIKYTYEAESYEE